MKEIAAMFDASGHGLMDLSGYDMFFAGKLTDYALPEEELKRSIESIRDLPKAELKKSGKW